MTTIETAIIATLVSFIKKLDETLALVADQDPKTGHWYVRTDPKGRTLFTVPLVLRPFEMSAKEIEDVIGRLSMFPAGSTWKHVVEDTMEQLGRRQMSYTQVRYALVDLRGVAKNQLETAKNRAREIESRARRVELEAQAAEIGIELEPDLPIGACEKRVASARAEIAAATGWVRNVGARVRAMVAELKLTPEDVFVPAELSSDASLTQAQVAKSAVDAAEIRVRDIKCTRELETKRLRDESERKSGIRTVKGRMVKGRMVTRDDERRDEEAIRSGSDRFFDRYPHLRAIQAERASK